MSGIQEYLSEQFYRWELRGRGWQVFPEPVALEPSFRPFAGHFLPPRQRIDDGRRHTRLSGFMESLWQTAGQPPAPEEPPDIEEEPEPNWRPSEDLIELQLTLPISRAVPQATVETFIRHVCRTDEQLSLEILGTAREIVPQFVASPRAATRVERALGAAIPGLIAIPSENALAEAWTQTGSAFAAAELGLAAEFMLPLGDPRADLLTEVVTALETLEGNELGLVQILFEPAQSDWTQSILTAVTDDQGRPFFSERPELLRAAEQKISAPLFGVVFRLTAAADDFSRCWEIIADMAAPFSALCRAGTNYLTPLDNEDYSPRDHEEDILNRQSRRSGMLLNLEELCHFLALPTSAVSGRLRRETVRTKALPSQTAQDGSLLLGFNQHAGVTKEVKLSPEQRVRHTHIIGASGTGKSTLLFNLIRQDIAAGQGIAVLDPHGDLIEKILDTIPQNRVGDVVLIDPADEEYSVGFNILAAHSDYERSLLASDLVGVFRRLSTSWGDQMNSVLRNAILAFLESTEGGTLADLRRFLLDPSFRKQFLQTVTDPEIIYYWENAFPTLSGNKSVGPVVTRLDEFLGRKPIRYMVSQKENRLNFAEVIDGGQILLAKLSHGLIGRENSYLLGSLLLSKIQQMAMSRQRIRESERRDFWCYVDEFPSFITPSMAEILTGARKYRVGLTLAHQELRQLRADDEVAGAVLANAFTRIAFRVGDADARALENGFSHFEARDLQNLEIGQAICRIERSDFDFNLLVSSDESPPAQNENHREEIIAASRAKYARPRIEIELELQRKFQEAKTEVSSRSAEKSKATEKKVSEEVPPGSEKLDSKSQAEVVPQGSEEKTGSGGEEFSIVSSSTPAVPSESEPSSPPLVARPVGQGRGGEDHQLIVANLAAEASRLGFRALKECVVPGGRVDLVVERGALRIAIEVAVRSNTAQEIENLQKCAESKSDVIISVSPHQNVRDNIAKATARTFDSETLAKIRYESVDAVMLFLQESAEKHPEIVPPGTPPTRVIAGRKVRARHVEMSPEERRRKEAEEIEVIAELLRKQSSKE